MIALRNLNRREAYAAVALLMATPTLFAGAALKMDAALAAGWILAITSFLLYIPTYLFSRSTPHVASHGDGAESRKDRRARQRAERRAGRN